ncbi:MAG: prolyl oligopeptidase family serine peptidase [Thermomicrobiales bacterium]
MIEARRGGVVDDFFGTAVADPYRWLEDPDDPETRVWSEAQSHAATAHLHALPARAAIHRRLTALWDYPRQSAPMKHGERSFFFKNDGLQNQPVLYVTDGPERVPVVLLDPNRLSADGTVALTTVEFSHDGAFLAYGISQSGSDWQEIRVREVATGEDGSDVLRWCKFSSIAWKRDGSGFFYNRFPEPDTVSPEEVYAHNFVYWHALGTEQADDPLVYEHPDATEVRFSPITTEDGKYLLLYGAVGTETRNRLYYRPIESNSPFIRLLDDADANYTPIEMIGAVLYLKTDLDAPRGRIIAIDLTRPDRANWREIVPEGDETIAFAAMIGRQFVVVPMRDASHRLLIYALDGALVREVAVPALGSIGELSGKRDDPELFFAFTSFLYPTTIYRCDMTTGDIAVLYEPETVFDPADYETTQVFYQSKDGTRVPMFLTHKRGLLLDGSHPTLLYGYGGFDISLTPAFAVSRLPWLEAGGVYAVANLRGGGEYGDAWHAAGKREKKQNVFDDFIAAGEWLIANGYTRSSRLAINGRSNGGLLVSACLVQQPDRFGAAICEVPVTDMLRFQKFTAGRYWTVEYGDAETSAEDFRFLLAYSPLHNVRPGVAYPPTLIATADADDRVVPSHAKKFTAALQAAHTGDAPILLRLELKAGHGQGKPTGKLIDEQADILAFLFDTFAIATPSRWTDPPAVIRARS